MHTADHSFVVLAFGDSPYLPGCLSSVLAQTLRSDVCISTTTPSPYIRSIAAARHVRVVEHPVSQGIASDWNLGYAVAERTYVTLAHQDDEYLPEYVETVMRAAASHNQPILAFTDYTEQIEGREVESRPLLMVKRALLRGLFRGRGAISAAAARRGLTLANPVCCPTIMYNRSVIGDARFDSAFSVNLDWDFLIRVSERGGTFLYIPRRLVRRRVHALSALRQAQHSGVRTREDCAILERFWPRVIARMIAMSYRVIS